MVAVTALALTAASLFAMSAFLQQRTARTIVGADAASLRDASGVKRLSAGCCEAGRGWPAG
jgi:hypothetical protein